jgi:hypothetical protein
MPVPVWRTLSAPSSTGRLVPPPNEIRADPVRRGRIVRMRTGGEKRRATCHDAAGFACRSRQSLGLSVITIEGSTTKKLIEPMRLFDRPRPAIYRTAARHYNDTRLQCDNLLKSTESSSCYAQTTFIRILKKPFPLTARFWPAPAMSHRPSNY